MFFKQLSKGKELELDGTLHNDRNKRYAVYLVVLAVLLINETSMSIVVTLSSLDTILFSGQMDNPSGNM